MTVHRFFIPMFVRNTVDVQTTSLDVEQIPISMKHKTAGNYFMKRFTKCARCAEFVSYYGMLFAALTESDHDVYSFTPRPFRIKVLGKPYVPDFVVARHGKREVIDLAKVANFATKQTVVKSFFENNGYTYSIVTYRDLKLHQIKAESWLQIVSVLVTTQNLSTTYEENKILEALMHNEIHTVGDVINVGDRQGSLIREVALFRLMHSGCVLADLDSHSLDYSTEIASC